MKNTQPIVFSINFRLNKQRAKYGKPAIYLRLTVNNKRIELATHLYLQAQFWDQKVQSPTGSTEEATEINMQLAIIKADLLKHYNKLIALDKNVTAELLKNEYLGISERQKTLKELMDFY